MGNDKEVLAFIKYKGKLVEDGYLDARKSGEVLVGLDELVRYFVYQESPYIEGFEFEIPVRIRKGSWETIIPDNIDTILLGLGAWLVAQYGGSALKEIAKNDFQDVSFKKIFKKAFKSIVSVIKLAKHLGTLAKKKFENIKFSENNELVKITNAAGKELWVPIEVIDLYSNCPETIFSKLTKIIEEERELVVGIYEDNIVEEETITNKYKCIFVKPDNEDDELVLPELKHGEYVEIQGRTTRGNEKSNTIGFFYRDHVITCYPRDGNIKKYKLNLFNDCLLKGIVSRLDKAGNINEKRPRIEIIRLENIESENKIKPLFDD